MAAPLGEGVRVGCLGPGFVWTWKDMGFRERSVLGEAGSSDRAPSFVRPLAHLFVQLSTPPASHTRNHPQLPHHRPSLNSESLEINRQFATQIHLLHKCSLLRLTAFLEKYTVPQKHSWGW